MEQLDRTENVVQRRQPVHVDARACVHEVAFRPACGCAHRPLAAEQPVLRCTEGEDDACGESCGRREYGCRADAPHAADHAAAARQIEHGSRRPLARSLAELRGGGPNAYGPCITVRADPKMHLKSAVVELLQLAIEIGGD